LAESDDSEIGKILKPFLGRDEEPVDRTDCSEEEILADYLNGSLTEVEKQKVQAHLVSCVACVDELVTVQKSMSDEAQDEVPQALIHEVKDFVSEISAQRSFLDLSVRLTETAIELIGTTGRRVDHMGADTIALRGRPRMEGGRLQIETEMGGFNVAVHVEQAEPRACDVVVDIRDASGVPADGMRVSLFSNDRERASYLTREGRVVFDRVTRGKYTVPIRDASTPVGTVRLDIA